MDTISELVEHLNFYENQALKPAALKLLAEGYSLSTFYQALSQSKIKLTKDDLDLVIVSCSSLGNIDEYWSDWISSQDVDCARCVYILDKLKQEDKSPESILADISKVQGFEKCEDDLLQKIVGDFSWGYADEIFIKLYNNNLLDIKLAKEIIQKSAPSQYFTLLEIINKDEGVLKEYQNQLLIQFFNSEMSINESDYERNTERYNQTIQLFLEMATDLLNDVRKGSGLVEKLVKSGIDLDYLIKNLRVLPLFKGLYLDIIIKNHSLAYNSKRLVKSLLDNDIYLGTFPDQGSLAKEIYDTLESESQKAELLDYYFENGVSKKSGLFG